MPTFFRLPARFPEGTKYVIEGRGAMVRRHIEYPDGTRVELSPRKAQRCACIEARQAGLATRPRRPARKGARKPAVTAA